MRVTNRNRELASYVFSKVIDCAVTVEQEVVRFICHEHMIYSEMLGTKLFSQ